MEDVESLRNSIMNDMENLGNWDDSVSELLMKGMKNYLSNFETINSDFENNWLTAEKLYKENYDLIIELGKYIETLKNLAKLICLLKMFHL